MSIANERRLPIALTLGDPCGIGPEVVLKACADPGLEPALRERLLVVGDPALIEREAARLGLPVPARIEPVDRLPADLVPGRIDPRAGHAAWRFVVHAARLALAGRVAAVVTAPLSKEAMHLAGHDYPGHTELLAELAGGTEVRMMLANADLRTVLVSIHVSLRDAIERVTRENVLSTIVITHTALVRAGIAEPRIAVAGLNPHAGESGAFGHEEIAEIAPAIADARARGIAASGPWPPDTVFMRARGFREFDAVVAMYHDQGLIPVKYLGLEDGVNITIGLPFVRTSPDHGTAFDIAGKPGPDGRGLADPRSMVAAIRRAAELAGAAPVAGAALPTGGPAPATPARPPEPDAGRA
ncbi:4-hydroxythreonine-4-phosphate dehydrogenase PdxA [Burkholderiaceae bacterium FT117]|uniref:4-hydroxythreonine-4-phosphate dehydrogenase PdxA n=1 Tax=Zeimonas sediminis TaxID=2944268 RepID=UPI002342EE33|nr:4-hydroxythreonine-4-phosphate dehydrogenase PdxA [Zeimonas sediminis]MCM5571199.1 4-hydroxythreonine-4-phosphate dehydrogenase PdxA [Zeimonas sediminis]